MTQVAIEVDPKGQVGGQSPNKRVQVIGGGAKCRNSKWNSLLGASCGGRAIRAEKTEESS